MLTIAILVMAVIPLIAAFYLLQDALHTSLHLGFNAQIVRTLERSSDNLRALARLDEENRAQYRAQFDEIEDLKQVYSNPEMVKRSVVASLRVYFGLGLGLAVLLSIGVATLLSRRIARSHAYNILELSRERDKVRYLQEMASWQELARMLAHEIKNPLTPIEVLVTSLSKAYLAKDQSAFLAHLGETQTMIAEELRNLKSTVNKFSEFARMPQVQLVEVDLATELRRLLPGLAGLSDAAEFDFKAPAELIRVRLDPTLFRQVLANVFRNGIETNAGQRVRFSLTLELRDERVNLRIANDGVPVAAEIADRMFDPYISSKSGKENMGLGLAIVKKIVLEHGGDIHHEEVAGHPVFVISLPQAAA